MHLSIVNVCILIVQMGKVSDLTKLLSVLFGIFLPIPLPLPPCSLTSHTYFFLIQMCGEGRRWMGRRSGRGGDRDYVSIHEHVYFMYIYISFIFTFGVSFNFVVICK